MIFIYVTCRDSKEAEKIGKHLLKRRLCACINIIPETHPFYLWPPKSRKIEGDKEAVLIVKTLESKYKVIETEILKLHSYTVPCIAAIPIVHMFKKYSDWLKEELDETQK